MRFALWGSLSVVWLLPSLIPAAETGQTDAAQTEFFERNVRPLLAKHCFECHSADTADDSGQLALDGRTGLLAGGSRGPLFVAGSVDQSLLIKAVRYVDPSLQMPPDSKLSDPEIDVLVKWIDRGAHVPDYGPEKQRRTKEIDWDTARRFWAFQPLHSPPIPSMESMTALQPVDAFIQEELTRHGLVTAPFADRRTLLRRLSFDLIGLPPGTEEIAEFESDESPDAYERQVDRLLASPHFGERWGRYWLDLVRYTDVTPSWLKNADQAWLYRDWVVRALNEDRSYDDFVKTQLAADVTAGVDPADYAALGLIGLSPTYWKELRLAPGVIEVIVADEWDERIDAVTRTFLGLTVACARCHDHKFDPITSRDYYALAGVFASTQLTDRPLLPSPVAEQVAMARQKVDQIEEALKAVKDKESDDARRMKSEIDALRTGTPQFDARMAHVVEEASVYVQPDGPEMTRLDVRRGQPRDLPVFRRGNPGNPGEIVPRRFVEVLSPGTPKPFESGSGRREFADALFSESRGLTARVMANRIWSHHFGRGLVRTPSDFGSQGERPSHPELLEWIAAEFAGPLGTESAWKMKRFHRQLVTSATYRQISAATDSATEVSITQSLERDPDNQWLGRMSRRRLEIEPWRDAMLSAAGVLDSRLGGPAIDLDDPGNRRRTLYGKVGRDEQNDMLRLFDFPPPTSHSPARDSTTTPIQQLFVLNSEFISALSMTLAQQVYSVPESSVSESVSRCYERLFQRPPTSEEREIGERFFATSGAESPNSVDRWSQYVQVLLGLNEMLFID